MTDRNTTSVFWSSASQKGKLRELTSILGIPLDLRPELYSSDPWVEFIDLDFEESTNRLTDLDPDCVLHSSLSSNCTPPINSLRDDDSGRASCCDPDLSSEPEASTIPPHSSSPTFCSSGCVAPDASDNGTLGREALYTQVSEVRSTGKVLLSPECEKSSSKELPSEVDLQDAVVNPHHGSNVAAGRSQTVPTAATRELCGSAASPAPVYTMVDGVNGQNSLLLTPDSTLGLQLIIPKSMPTPTGYLTPDLMESITP